MLLLDPPIDLDTKCWWKLKSGRVLGISNGMLLEYDRSTLAPLGLVVSKDELLGKKIAIVDSGVSNNEEQAVLVYDEEARITVVQPNEDGSYWRKIVRNKIARMQERRREKAAQEFAERVLNLEEEEPQILSHYGPYTTTSGVAKTTAIVSDEYIEAILSENDDESSTEAELQELDHKASNFRGILVMEENGKEQSLKRFL
jgi:hypothetical protein